jgi:serine/threonine protein kinase
MPCRSTVRICTFESSTFLLFDLCDSTLQAFETSPPEWSLILSPHEIRNLIINWMIDLSFVLRAFHEKGGLHGNIKPENILLRDCHIYLSDFGLGILGSKVSELPASVSATEIYKAPEMETNAFYSRKADVFSLGCIFLEMLAILNNINISGFHKFRQTFSGTTCCTHSDNRCYRHNLDAVDFALEQLGKISGPDMGYIVDTVGLMLSPSPRARPSSDETWKHLLWGSKRIRGFQKMNCCTDNPKVAGYSSTSINSLTAAMAGLSLQGKERPFDWAEMLEVEGPFKNSPLEH